MPKLKKVSVIIPTFNRADFIESSVKSALDQKGDFEVEVIVIDNGSTDGTKELLEKKFGDKILFLSIPSAGRPSIPRNVGIDAATGDYIAFLDSDDVWLPKKLSTELKAFDKETVLVYSNAEYIDKNGKKIGKRILSKGEGKSGDIFEQLLSNNFISTLTVVAPKHILVLAGKFNESKNLTAVEDYELWLRICQFGEVRFVDDVLALYRVHDTNISGPYDLIAKRRLYALNKEVVKHASNLNSKITAFPYLIERSREIGNDIFIFKLLVIWWETLFLATRAFRRIKQGHAR